MLSKEDTIAELKKLSKEIGGKTPSEQVFREHTGIVLNDLQKYGWASYGEFIDEAGLKRNKFDKTKYNREDLCDLFIEIIREKKKLPTRGELEVKHKRDKKFPASGTFYKKLGLVRVLAKTILEYVKDKHGYGDVVSICNSFLEDNKVDDEQEGEIIIEGKHGWVYLIKHGHYNHYRIGETGDPLRRFRENRIELPEKPTLVHEIETADRKGVEQYWLNHFELKKTSNKDGDWFKLSPSDIKEFKRWKKIV